jgi:hypothetical protein
VAQSEPKHQMLVSDLGAMKARGKTTTEKSLPMFHPVTVHLKCELYEIGLILLILEDGKFKCYSNF